jgi:hypothetical protein
MRRSHWFTEAFSPVQGGNTTRHYLMVFAGRQPLEHADAHLAEKLGDLDPFVRAIESGRGCTLAEVPGLTAQAAPMLRAL